MIAKADRNADDPRAELRWCLSKLRSVLDEPKRQRILTREDTVQLDLADCRVDAIEIARAAHEGIEKLALIRSTFSQTGMLKLTPASELERIAALPGKSVCEPVRKP